MRTWNPPTPPRRITHCVNVEAELPKSLVSRKSIPPQSLERPLFEVNTTGWDGDPLAISDPPVDGPPTTSDFPATNFRTVPACKVSVAPLGIVHVVPDEGEVPQQ